MPLTFGALPFQTHRRRKAAEQRELSAEHYRACWELLSVAPGEGLTGVDGKPVGRHRRNSVRDGNRSLVHLLKEEAGKRRGGVERGWLTAQSGYDTEEST